VIEQVKKDQERYVYIYNPLQSNYYISQGVMIKEVGIHNVTKKPWYKFSFLESEEAYHDWCVRER